ncbi:MAG: CTP synthase [Candidatus Aenigmarchaeota archaeon]|nr:CTP synthase [Candidatus Aenigmarchaeota archaeon]
MKLIVVTGGVISGVGKGVATASIGKILKEYGYSVTAVKIDPYVNVDAGTMRPTEHGEVWVTEDGGEIDQDLGNYERFLDIDISKHSNITTGQVYRDVIQREREGKYLGKTVQIIPHIIDEIKDRIRKAGNNHDFVLVEIGGTVGDYENIPFLFAVKSLEIELGKKNVVYVLVSYLPTPIHMGEAKTKPTQQAIRMLNENGITPDFILCRAPRPIDEVRRKKIEVSSNISSEYIISAPDVASTIYRIPLNFEAENLGKKMLEKFNLGPCRNPDWKRWRELVDNIENPREIFTIAMVGKYVGIGDFQLADSYISINESLKHAAAELGGDVRITWIDANELEAGGIERLRNFDGIIIPGGFGSSGVEGKINAIKYARENNIPFLGLCYGMQLAVIEFARNACSMTGAHTTEVDTNTPYPVIDILASQKKLIEHSKYGGTMRLGAYAAVLKEGTRVLDLYRRAGRLETDGKAMSTMEKFRLGIIAKHMFCKLHNSLDLCNIPSNASVIIERHRHRYEVNPKYIEQMESKGLVFSGHHQKEDGTKLMEFTEMPDHHFFIATQAHPEFKSRFGKPAPLFLGFLEACLKK